MCGSAGASSMRTETRANVSGTTSAPREFDEIRTVTLKQYEVRDPVHGLIAFNGLECDIINHPAFQRLRRIRQLAWTDMVYPGAMHTRFEHSLGVMHVATRLFETVRRRSKQILESEYDFEEGATIRWRQIIRLAALLHDVGHTPFSHSGEGLFPVDDKTGKQLTHESYSASILRHQIADVIDSNTHASNIGIKTSDVERLFGEGQIDKPSLAWKALLSGQMDADRMDYLLRDSHHSGVAYGRYDLDRVVATVEFCPDKETGGHELGVGDDGIHAVEGLLIARYMMFTQVYFHKTRAIYDHHLVQALKTILETEGGKFPLPTKEGITDYLKWDDWRVLGAIARNEAGKHGEILRERNHYRCIHATSETPSEEEVEKIKTMKEALGKMDSVIIPAEKSWYQSKNDILVAVHSHAGSATEIKPLSALSSVVGGLKPINMLRLYVPPRDRAAAQATVAKLGDSK
jgi:HD superfamily phosphohydrolase